MRIPAALLLLGFAVRVCATPVSVTIESKTATSPEDTIVIFDSRDGAPAAAQNAVNIDQVDRKFLPRINVIRTGTSVSFPNSDNVRHQVYSFSTPKIFTLKLYSGQPSAPVVFDKPGLVVLGCNIHDRMSAFVGIVDTPYFGKADARGSLTLNLPPGRYRMRIWHPNLTSAVAAQDITVQDSALSLKVAVSVEAATPNVATWPE